MSIFRLELFGATSRDLGPRYEVRVLDDVRAGSAAAPAACFIVPQGREHEFLFAADEGLRQIAASANCARLIAVTLCSRRGHLFGDLAAVQAELGPAVASLAPLGTAEGARINFMTVGGDDLGTRTVIATARTASGDECFVEEVGPSRRLVFASNPSVVQTEAALRPTTGRAHKAGRRKKKGAAKGEEATGMRPVDHEVLSSAYHVALLGLAAAVDNGGGCGGSSSSSSRRKALLVGLGGGVLAMALRAYIPALDIHVRELDPEVLSIAETYFGFRCAASGTDPKTIVTIGDGLEAFDDDAAAPAAAAGPFDLVVVDVDAKDPSLGMCCPPEAFVAEGFLRRVRAALEPTGGLACVNVVARDAAVYSKTCAAFKAVFGGVGVLRPCPDDVNRVLVGRAAPFTVADGPEFKAALKARVTEWLLTRKRLDDPLELLDTLDALEFL